MAFDASLPTEPKLQYLLANLDLKFAERDKQAVPVPLYEADYPLWNSLRLAQSCVLHFFWVVLRNSMTLWVVRAPDEGKRKSALHNLGGILERRGRYVEAERIAKDEVLPWILAHEALGESSPQALGCMRIIARSVWKQGKYEEVGMWIERCRKAVEDMAGGKFEKYQETEGRLIDDNVQALEKWKEEHETTSLENLL
jgi:hypothetical protein